MPTICGYKFEGDAVIVVIPISDSLIRDACDREAVGRLAGELASKTAVNAIAARGAEYDAEVD